MYRHYFLGISLFLISCSVEDLAYENDLDPQNPEFTEPQTTLKPVSSDNFSKSSFVIEWQGNISSMEFRHKLDQKAWSEWEIQTSTTLNYLDEGSHLFLVQGRYLSGYVEATPDSLPFTTDAVTGPGLRIAPLFKEAVNGDAFTVDIMAEDLSNVAGAEILILFDASVLAYQSIDKGEFFGRAQGLVLEITKLKASNLLQIDIGAYNGTFPAASGTGVIATIHFNTLKVGQSSLTLQNDCSLRDKDNNVLTYNSLVNGLVDVK